MKKLLTLLTLLFLSSASNADFIETDAKKLVISALTADINKLRTLTEKIDQLNKKRLSDIVSAKNPSNVAAQKWYEQNESITFFLDTFKDLERVSYIAVDSVVFIDHSHQDQNTKAMFFRSLCIWMPGKHGIFTNLKMRGNQRSQEYIESLLSIAKPLDSKDRLLINEAALVADRIGIAYADICSKGADPKNW